MNCANCSANLQEDARFCSRCGQAVSPSFTRDPFIGRSLINQYLITKQLGAGGFGAVYEAEQPALQSKAAIKVLHSHLNPNPTMIARFRREGIAARRLEHPAALRIYNFGETHDGYLWIAMEFLEGQTLETYLTKKATLSPNEIMELLGPIFGVLKEAHEKGIIHRDLKPQNLMLVSSKGKLSPKLLDFGFADYLDDVTLTKTGIIGGTPSYMPPEQWEGLKKADHRSDIYSLAIIVYQCLSGRRPFEAGSLKGWMDKHCKEAPLSLTDAMAPRSVAPVLSDVLVRALMKNPDDRYQSMSDFYQALSEAFQQATSELTLIDTKKT